MKSKKRFYGIALVLFALMLCKVSAFHVYAHDNEPENTIENCSICDVALENQDSDLALPIDFDSLTTIVFLPFAEVDFHNEVCFYNGLSLGEYYCRPPPPLV